MSGMEIKERPRTSRGRRSHCEQDTGSGEFERPVSRRGHNTIVKSTARPLTRQGRNSISDTIPKRPETCHGRQSEVDSIERPMTRHNRIQSETIQLPQELDECSSSHVDILTLDGGIEPPPPPKPNICIRGRPKSAKGRVRPRPAQRPSVDRGIFFLFLIMIH